MFDSFLEKLYAEVAKIPFDTLMWATFGSFGVLYLVCLTLTLRVARFRALSKRPFLCLANAYAAVTLGFFLLHNTFVEALFAAVIFWIAAYVLYGTLCLASPRVRSARNVAAPLPSVLSSPAPALAPAAPPTVPLKPIRAEVPAARNTVRLEHAVSVTDKLLEKNLGKSDRQELEKLKNTLAVLQIKGTLSTAETEILNENFNTLLKLMAKYNI